MHGIGNHFICITQFSVPYQWPESPTELVLYSRYTNLSIQSKHPYQHTALHHNEVWIVLVSCCVPTVVLFPSQEAQLLRPSAERKMASKIILLAIQKRELLIIRRKKCMKKLLEMQAKWFLSFPPPKNQMKKLLEMQAFSSDILFPTVFYLCIPTAWGSEGKYTDAESTGPQHTTAWNTHRVEFYLICDGDERGCSEMLRVAPKITLVFAFRV